MGWGVREVQSPVLEVEPTDPDVEGSGLELELGLELKNSELRTILTFHFPIPKSEHGIHSLLERLLREKKCATNFGQLNHEN